MSVAGLPNSKLKGAGKAFLSAFTKATARQGPDPYCGVRGSGRDRDAERDREVGRHPRERDHRSSVKTNLPNSILGNVAFNAQGDVKGGPVAIYRIKGGKSTDYAVINPPEALVKSA